MAAAVTVTGEPWMKVSVYGVVWVASPTVTLAPLGELAKVRSTVFGLSWIVAAVGEAAAVRDGHGQQQVRGVLVRWRGEAAGRAAERAEGCVWQTPLGQCRISSCQLNAEAGIGPCWGSLAVAL